MLRYSGFVALFGVARPFQAVKNQVKPKNELGCSVRSVSVRGGARRMAYFLVTGIWGTMTIEPYLIWALFVGGATFSFVRVIRKARRHNG